jgi:hypothetical protein
LLTSPLVYFGSIQAEALIIDSGSWRYQCLDTAHKQSDIRTKSPLVPQDAPELAIDTCYDSVVLTLLSGFPTPRKEAQLLYLRHGMQLNGQ